MEKEFVTYAEAVALKELGFDEPCIKEFHDQELLSNSTGEEITNNELIELYGEQTVISAPTFSQAFRWFREKYQIDSCIHRNGGMNIDERGFLPYYEVIIRYKSPELKCVKYSHEESELECLKKLIEIVKERQ
jgi:hypothetical protein